MDLRQITGLIAHVLLGLYWLWVISSSAPQLRRGARDRPRRLRILMIKTAGVAVTALAVGVIHFWATEWWHVIAALVIAVALGLLLHRAYRTQVAAPRHRRTLTQRARRFESHFRPPPVA
ncbi:hypothetical protein [Pseudonocardia sp. GCM10023141]|uniref:hypothetical protein n=1 Tax=Pseudonocardia sp. GCM10023141 TaxID=3252653 RepID=UPI003611F92D